VSAPGARAALERVVGPLPRTTADVRAVEDRWQVPTYAKLDVALAEGKGCWVTDVEGKRYLDLYGGHAVALLGHGHPSLVAAIRAQAERLVFYSNVVYSDVRAAAVERLAALAPEGLRRVFLCNSGTEANETALKIARKATGRTRVVSADEGFHGRTLGSLAATGIPSYRDPAWPLPAGHAYVPFGDLEAVDRTIDRETAAVIVEPIPSVGGIRVAEPDYYRGLRDLCTARGAMLVFDEVQTGFGRTGRMWFGDHFGVRPDLITGAKGIAGGFPAGVVFVREDLAARMKVGEQGTTFGGGPLACAAIAATARTILEEDLPAHAAEVGNLLRDGFPIPVGAPGADEAVRAVRSVVGMGLMIGVNLDRPYGPVVKALAAAGVLVGGGGGPNQIRLLPPLVVTAKELLGFPEALAKVLAPERS
jgi:acetylornithine/succinyldiaminopimelate/putrescine aminotransferase